LIIKLLKRQKNILDDALATIVPLLIQLATTIRYSHV